MNLTEEQRKEFEELARNLMKFLAENCHPHTSVAVDSTTAELREGVTAITTEEYLVD